MGEKFGCLCLESVNRSCSEERKLWVLGGHFLFPLTLGQVLRQWFVSELPGCASSSALHGATRFLMPGTPRSGVPGTPLTCVLRWLSLRVGSTGGLPMSGWDRQLVFPALVPSRTCRAHQWGFYTVWCCTSSVTKSLLSTGIVFPMMSILEALVGI